MSAVHPVLNPARVRSDVSLLGRESEQYLSTVESFHDDEFDKPSHCEGWKRAQVVAHVAVAARRLTRLLDWAQTGEEQQLFESKDERTELLEQLRALILGFEELLLLAGLRPVQQTGEPTGRDRHMGDDLRPLPALAVRWLVELVVVEGLDGREVLLGLPPQEGDIRADAGGVQDGMDGAHGTKL